MASRAPVGGIVARYTQVVEEVARSAYEEEQSRRPRVTLQHYLPQPAAWVPQLPAWDSIKENPGYNHWFMDAEDRLCGYPLHPKVQRFFDDFVGKYGHSSIMELTGSPAVYTEGISWFTAWQLFDSPLCSGQEFSTRAVQHKDWPMARECRYSELEALHNDWFEVFEAEVAWWKNHLSDEENRLALGIGDKEPFRPALDRARWALPGTIATGCAHTTSLRERARVLQDGKHLALASLASAATDVWDEITETYRQALPGLAGMGLREAVYSTDTLIPGHMRTVLSSAEEGPDVEIHPVGTRDVTDVPMFKRTRERSYLDVAANTAYRVNVGFRCSLAVARDWHRHRTLFPWYLQVVRAQHLTSAPGPIQIDHHYQPMSDLAKAKTPELLERSTRMFDSLMANQNRVQAALALPLGTRVRMTGQGGLRDVVYMLELRKNAAGANFEYKEQATTGLELLHAAQVDPDGRFGWTRRR